MKANEPFILLAILAGALPLSVIFFQSELATELHLDFWRLPALRRALEEDMHKGEDLSARIAIAQAYSRAKDEIIDGLLTGRLSLREAASECRRLDLQAPHFSWQSFADAYPGKSDGERYCREVIHFVHLQLRGQPDRGAVIARLEAELRNCLKQHGTVPLEDARR